MTNKYLAEDNTTDRPTNTHDNDNELFCKDDNVIHHIEIRQPDYHFHGTKEAKSHTPGKAGQMDRVRQPTNLRSSCLSLSELPAKSSFLIAPPKAVRPSLVAIDGQAKIQTTEPDDKPAFSALSKIQTEPLERKEAKPSKLQTKKTFSALSKIQTKPLKLDTKPRKVQTKPTFSALNKLQTKPIKQPRSGLKPSKVLPGTKSASPTDAHTKPTVTDPCQVQTKETDSCQTKHTNHSGGKPCELQTVHLQETSSVKTKLMFSKPSKLQTHSGGKPIQPETKPTLSEQTKPTLSEQTKPLAEQTSLVDQLDPSKQTKRPSWLQPRSGSKPNQQTHSLPDIKPATVSDSTKLQTQSAEKLQTKQTRSGSKPSQTTRSGVKPSKLQAQIQAI